MYPELLCPSGPEEDFVYEGFHYADEWLFAGPSYQYQTWLVLTVKTVFLICAYVSVP